MTALKWESARLVPQPMATTISTVRVDGAAVNVRANVGMYGMGWDVVLGDWNHTAKFDTIEQGQAWALANLPAMLRKLADDLEALAKETT